MCNRTEIPDTTKELVDFSALRVANRYPYLDDDTVKVLVYLFVPTDNELCSAQSSAPLTRKKRATDSVGGEGAVFDGDQLLAILRDQDTTELIDEVTVYGA